MLIALVTWPAQPTYWRATPVVCSPFFSCPVSSRTATASGTPRCPGHEVAHDALRFVFVPHGVAQQPLHLVRAAVPGPLSQGPAVLAGGVAGQAIGVLTRLAPRLPASEHPPQPAQQLIAVRAR